MPALQDERLRMAEKLVRRQHPMRKEPLTSALPFLQPIASCFCCGRRDRGNQDGLFSSASAAPQGEDTQQDEDNQRLEANQANANSERRQNDPFLVYGAGIANYFRLQENLLWLFFFLTIGACLQMGIFRSFGGMDAYGEFVTTTAAHSFGNMGFSSTVCSKFPIDWRHDTSVTMTARCQGTTSISGVLASGMMLDDAFPYGKMDAVHDCYYDVASDPELATYEMRQFRKENFEKVFMDACEGKEFCQVEVPFEDFARGPAKS